MSPLQAAIAVVVEQHPNLSAFGWHIYSGAEHEDRCRAGREQMATPDFARQVLDVFVDVGSRRAGPLSSYGLKHRVEARCGRSVTNGAAIVAMIILGYEPYRFDGPNCGFRRMVEIQPHAAFRGQNTHTWAGP